MWRQKDLPSLRNLAGYRNESPRSANLAAYTILQRRSFDGELLTKHPSLSQIQMETALTKGLQLANTLCSGVGQVSATSQGLLGLPVSWGQVRVLRTLVKAPGASALHDTAGPSDTFTIGYVQDIPALFFSGSGFQMRGAFPVSSLAFAVSESRIKSWMICTRSGIPKGLGI